MPAVGLKSILLIHGYSVRSLNSWGQLPTLLGAEGYLSADIQLSAFVSLDDYVTCDDLAAALEDRVVDLEAAGLDLRKTAIVVHSTGALVARRWLLNRYQGSKKPMPRTFFSAAGANHGSTLAQAGKTELAHVFREVTEKTSVGQLVLTDLDYGSQFLHRLNREWLDAWNAPGRELWKQTYCFSIGGTDHSFWENHLAWQSREPGSDGTVRVSAANLNYRFITVDAPYTSFRTETLAQAAPHLVIDKYSHTSQSQYGPIGWGVGIVGDFIQHGTGDQEPISTSTLGILEGVANRTERPFAALLEAFDVADADSFTKTASGWAKETAVWTETNINEAASTIVVTIADQRNSIVQDSLVVIGDSTGSIGAASASLIGNQIRNAVTPSIVSLYVNYAKFHPIHPHSIHVEAVTQTEFIDDGVKIDAQISGQVDNAVQHVIEANEVTYVDVRANRSSKAALQFYGLDYPNFAKIVDQSYPPFPA